MAQPATPATPFSILPNLVGEFYIIRQECKSWECFDSLTGILDAVEAILSGDPALVGKGDEGEAMLNAARRWNQRWNPYNGSIYQNHR